MTDSALPKKQLIEKLLTVHARENGTTASRIRRWVTTMVLIGALDRVRDIDDAHRFIVKGGVAMELRLGLRARATQDVDFTFHGDTTELTASLATAFANPYAGFEFLAGEPIPIGTTGAFRLDVRVRYLSKGWATTRVEIAVTPDRNVELEVIPAISLADFRIDGPDRVAALSIRYQMAQKIHAVTQRFATGDNMRVRDIIDLLLLADVVTDLAAVRDACVEVFESRGTHSWPPEVVMYDPWPAMYARLVTEIGFPIKSLPDAVESVQRLIADIDQAD